uniref:Ig-like domain-containing protein n=1 Tax=Suricata suricatta TaxID=37032 RepID=A0A673VBE5_SURSU
MDLSRPRCRRWRELVLLASLLACGIRHASGRISITQILGIRGLRSVLVLQNVTQDAQEYSWHRGANDTAENMIVSYKPPSHTWQHGPMFSGRENVTKAGDLVINTSTLNDTGNYTVRVDFGNGTETATGYLNVQELEKRPDIWANTSTAVEYMGSVAAHCSTNATVIKWYVDYAQVSSNDRMTISPDLKTLVIYKVGRYDRTLQCETASIPDFPQRSDPLSLTVAYGPDKVQLSTSHIILNGVLAARIGSQVRMSCPATSQPNPKYHWMHNGTRLSVSEATVILPSLSWEQMGRYRCIVENPVTQIVMYQEFQIRVHTAGEAQYCCEQRLQHLRSQSGVAHRDNSPRRRLPLRNPDLRLGQPFLH